MSSLLPLEQNDKYRRPQRIICADAPHRECIRYATHSEFFTGPMNTDRHDLPHPYFFATAQWNQFHCKRQFNNSQQYEFISRIFMRTKSTAKTRPAKPAQQGSSASNRRTIPLGEMPINRETATNRSSSRFNKIERID
ncbi:hypothetical protein [Burkholderia sp. BCC1644]|uniref:hypothetical protein n=1 Tax=Burkholderia sp. BCC1644 TaxID=2676293 RepID=UPI001FC81EDA|nr:hypothetical protein [Burkholderia sp. BCC1644]